MGLVDSVVNAEKLDEACVELASSISKNAPIAVRSAKFAINAGANVDLSTGLAIERNAYEITIPTKDRIEALHAFREKRAARFTGE
jgi:enoyl-CoA hydratase/carnithine racemase